MALIILCLPVSLMFLLPWHDLIRQFINESGSFTEGVGLFLLLMVAMDLPKVFIFGYTARTYRGTGRPPGFENCSGLVKDGVRIWLIALGWSVPMYTGLILAFALLYCARIFGNNGMNNRYLVIIALLIACITALLYALFLLFRTIGYIRYARTGSSWEGVNFREIIATLGRIGWGNYLLAFVVFVAVIVAVAILVAVSLMLLWWFVMLLFRIPSETIRAHYLYGAHILSIILTPVFFVFEARFFTWIYETGIDAPGGR